MDMAALRAINPRLDEKDLSILATRVGQFDENAGPRVGDFVMMPGEEHPRRFTYDWGDDMQTTVGPGHPCSGNMSFYLSHGHASFSGSLDHAILKSRLTELPEDRPGSFWFFHHHHVTAHNAVQVKAPCRVFRYTE